jgi:hypothetical protein
MAGPVRLMAAVGAAAVVAAVPVSVSAAAKPLTAPQNFAISRNLFTKTATISWTPPKPNGQTITGYKAAESGGGTFSKILGPGARSYRFHLQTGVVYTLSVRAVTATQVGPAASGLVEL